MKTCDTLSQSRPCQPADGPRQAPETSGLSRLTLLVFAVTCGSSVANIYYAQPLLDAIAATFAIHPAAVGLVVTLTQVGYAVGLLFLVPLGDLLDRRKLVIGQTLLSALALAVVAGAPNALTLFGAMIVVGLLAVVLQVLVALSATLARPEERGAAVGLVTGGVVIGILAARFVAGILADVGGWRIVYLVSAGFMLLLGALLMRVLPRTIPVASAERYGSVLKSMPLIFLNEPVLRLRAGLAFLIFASFSTLWTAMVLPLSAALRSARPVYPLCCSASPGWQSHSCRTRSRSLPSVWCCSISRCRRCTSRTKALSLLAGLMPAAASSADTWSSTRPVAPWAPSSRR